MCRLLPLNEEYLIHKTVLNAIFAFEAFVWGVYTQVSYMKKLVNFRLSTKAALITAIAYFEEYRDPNHRKSMKFYVYFGTEGRFIRKSGSTKPRYNHERRFT